MKRGRGLVIEKEGRNTEKRKKFTKKIKLNARKKRGTMNHRSSFDNLGLQEWESIEMVIVENSFSGFNMPEKKLQCERVVG